MENAKQIGQKRAFLNEPFDTSLTSMVGYSIELDSWDKSLIEAGFYDRAEVKFSMSDCSRTINLDFEMLTKDEMRNSLFKIDTIIDICQSMRKDLKAGRLILRQGVEKKKELEAIKLEELKDKNR